MKILAHAALALLLASAAAPSQKKSTLLGDSWDGVVVAYDPGTRRLALRALDEKKKDETFAGVLSEKLNVNYLDNRQVPKGAFEVRPGERVTVYYKTKTEEGGGRKVKVNVVTGLYFLGIDEFAPLRARLGLPPATPVALAESKPLPAGDPLKLYVYIESAPLREGFGRWLARWRKERAAEFGAVEVVAELSRADAALVAYDWRMIAADPIVYGPSSDRPLNLGFAAVLLLTPGGGGFDVIWRQKFFFDRESSSAGRGKIFDDLEKRLRARARR